jgi:ribonuclease P protein component
VYRERSGSLRFGSEFRLKSDPVIRDVLATGRRFSGQYLDLRLKVYDDTMRQFCIRAPRAVCNAVCRNKVKRLIREELRKRMERIRPGTRAVFLLRGVPRGGSMYRLLADLKRLLDNA